VTDPNLPPPEQPQRQVVPPRQGSTVWRGTKWAFGGCIVLPVFLVIGFIGCFALLGGTGEETGSGAEGGGGVNEKNRDALRAEAAKVGDTVKVGDVAWTVTDVNQETKLRSFGDRKKGNFVIVDLTFANNGNKPITIDTASLAIPDEQGRTHETNPDASYYVPTRLDIFLEQVNPGVTQKGRVFFSIAPDASGLILRAGDGVAFTEENGYVDLGM
jgi:Domain of unknown function (DUF4352)